MFSLALKNAILLILIILILHILIKNYLINFQKQIAEPPVFEELQMHSNEPEPSISVSKKADEIKQDENELYSFLFQKTQSQPKPEQGALLSSMELGTISKFGDYAMI